MYRSKFVALFPLALTLVRLAHAAPAPLPGNPPSPGPPLSLDSEWFQANQVISGGQTLTDTWTAILANAQIAGSTYLWDVDVSVSITHPRGEDLELALIAPGGRTVTLSTDNGGLIADVYGNTVFDDSATLAVTEPNALTTVQYVVPEGALSSLQGIVVTPGQSWKLRVRDDSTNVGQTGTLLSWKLDIATLATSSLARYGPTSQFITIPRAIPNNGISVLNDYAIGGNTGSFLAELQVFVKLTHPRPEQLEIKLLGPNGYIPLSLRNGATSANAFDGTLWFDAARQSSAVDLPTTDANYSVLGAKPNLVPEGSLGSLIGTDPNGGYSLRIFDNLADGNAGTLHEWGVTLWTYDPPVTVTNCVAGHSAYPCTPQLTYSGGLLTATQVDNNRTALVFYGASGTQVFAWGPWSTLCVKAPLQRTGVVNSGSIAAPPCSGVVSVGWAAHLSANPNALGNQVLPGALVSAQMWWRDPASTKTTQLSNMVQFLAP